MGMYRKRAELWFGENRLHNGLLPYAHARVTNDARGMSPPCSCCNVEMRTASTKVAEVTVRIETAKSKLMQH